MNNEPILEVGQPAPVFRVISGAGEAFDLAVLRGRPVVLFFYPQANTEGCTIETMEFDALLPQFEKLDVVVAGISPDSVEALARFRASKSLNIQLLSDPQRRIIVAYGLWREKTTFGRAYLGLVRTTVLIGADGTLRRIWTVKRVKNHAAEVLDAVRQDAQCDRGFAGF